MNRPISPRHARGTETQGGEGAQPTGTSPRFDASGCGTVFEDRRHVRVGAASLELPTSLAPRGTSSDSASAVFEGSGVLAIVDQGPFAPSLDADVGRPQFRQEAIEISGSPARLVNYDDDDGASYVTAVEVDAPRRVTVVVRAEHSVPRELPLRIVQSLRLLD